MVPAGRRRTTSGLSSSPLTIATAASFFAACRKNRGRDCFGSRAIARNEPDVSVTMSELIVPGPRLRATHPASGLPSGPCTDPGRVVPGSRTRSHVNDSASSAGSTAAIAWVNSSWQMYGWVRNEPCSSAPAIPSAPRPMR